jgi:hypothetical protein
MSGYGPGCVKIAQLGRTDAFRGRRASNSVESTSCRLSGKQEHYVGADLVAQRPASRPHRLQQSAYAHDHHHALHVVGEYVERHLGGHLWPLFRRKKDHKRSDQAACPEAQLAAPNGAIIEAQNAKARLFLAATSGGFRRQPLVRRLGLRLTRQPTTGQSRPGRSAPTSATLLPVDLTGSFHGVFRGRWSQRFASS